MYNYETRMILNIDCQRVLLDLFLRNEWIREKNYSTENDTSTEVWPNFYSSQGVPTEKPK